MNPMEPRMYRAEPSLVMNAERSRPKLPGVPKVRADHASDSMRDALSMTVLDTLPD
jgi:hypothetical protein